MNDEEYQWRMKNKKWPDGKIMEYVQDQEFKKLPQERQDKINKTMNKIFEDLEKYSKEQVNEKEE